MSQVIVPPMESETLEMSILRLPECINTETAPQIMADLDRLLQPHSGLMLDFSQTAMLDPDAAHIVSLAHRLAAERQATIGTMGENEQIQAVLQFAHFFDRVQKSL
jgi:anti-anti-sigma regulatory factor